MLYSWEKEAQNYEMTSAIGFLGVLKVLVPSCEF